MKLILDEGVQGYRKEYTSKEALRRDILKLLDENVERIVIKKRVAANNSQDTGIKGDF